MLSGRPELILCPRASRTSSVNSASVRGGMRGVFGIMRSPIDGSGFDGRPRIAAAQLIGQELREARGSGERIHDERAVPPARIVELAHHARRDGVLKAVRPGPKGAKTSLEVR